MEDVKLKILRWLGISFMLSLCVGIILNNSIGWAIVGIFMFGFLFYALGLTFKLISPQQFYSVIFEKAGNDYKQPKFYGYIFTGAMVTIGLIWIVVSVFVWFIYYV
jgi:hypothetical protein